MRRQPAISLLQRHDQLTSPLLEEHGNSCKHYTTKHRHSLEQRPDSDELQLDCVPGRSVGQAGEALCNRSLLKQRLGLDLKVLQLDQLVVLWQSAETRKRLPGLCLPAMVLEPSWTERHEYHTNAKEHSWDKLQSQWNEPCRVVLAFAGTANVIGAVVYPEANHDSRRDRELLEADQGATHYDLVSISSTQSRRASLTFWRSDFCVVHRHNHR